MEPITHQIIRALLQAAADRPLLAAEQATVRTHLAQCKECQAYATQLDELQDGLRRVTRQQWNKSAASLPLQTIKERSRRMQHQKRVTANIGRFAVAPLLVFAFVLVIRMVVPPQIAANTIVLTIQTPQLAQRTPTPTHPNTSTESIVQECNKVAYVVQKGDTLGAIAARFGVEPEAILSFNGLASDRLDPNTTLIIPICGATPTGTSTAPAVTITTQPLDAMLAPAPEG